jgi:hypothetical protein
LQCCPGEPEYCCNPRGVAMHLRCGPRHVRTQDGLLAPAA